MITLIIIVAVLCILLLLNIVLTAFEKSRLSPNGKLVEVNGNKLHVYAEGKSAVDKPTLVFMSGSGTTAPVYDFKPIYSKLSDKYRIAVIEKLGYGYSDTVNADRDIDSMLADTREALIKAGEKPPYALAPHSMSGIEALYWAQKYPNEISSIIGLDMAVPSAYENAINIKLSLAMANVIRVLKLFGIHRLFFFAVTSKNGLSSNEYKQSKSLGNINLLNKVCRIEGKFIESNAKIVKSLEMPKTRYLMFCSNGKEIGAFWDKCQTDFADQVGAKLIKLDCGHYIHQYKSDELAVQIQHFLEIQQG